ncbi:DUF2188 domain-containing protein [Brevundimonas sp. Root1423]|uniref:DUF2188 domain-containing protein n=1 Tax=Brevundimonas sp. Root1423 TaxID=1736462 RepID=UPI00070099F7|nr:DUF2188 domain-containing protein [Brevundimonas sp. Root1423]KQY89800.1 hypothetical protein ASD25_04535 [Brevundimonas sp. Root1423]
MSNVVYRIVEHDGGWAYQVDGTYSETFRTHDLARAAASRAAAEQLQPGRSASISYEDGAGTWRQERVGGSDRPTTSVEG